MNIDTLIRNNIRSLKPYSSARHEYSGTASVLLDANENPFETGYNRYPDPLQIRLKEKIAGMKKVLAANIFLGNGSDEAIDFLIRIFCEPGLDRIIICPPTYGIYETAAAINDVCIRKIPLDANFQLDTEAIKNASDNFTKLLFICSPNNPTGNSIKRSDIEIILKSFKGIIIIDEAYIDYSRQTSFINELNTYPNLVVLQTLSKAWGLAGLRLGMAFASAEIINYLNKIKYPYNINAASQKLVLDALDNEHSINAWTKQIIGQRKWLREHLAALPFVIKVYPSDANFVLVRTDNADAINAHLLSKGIVVRIREGCLRITVGTPAENDKLIKELNYLIL
jgi:histidinol-phosphate aminotransferase